MQSWEDKNLNLLIYLLFITHLNNLCPEKALEDQIHLQQVQKRKPEVKVIKSFFSNLKIITFSS